MSQNQTAIETNKNKQKKEKRELHVGWLGRMFIRPKSTMEKVVATEKSVWLLPLLVLTILVLVATVIGGPVRRATIEASMQQPPDDFQYWSDTDQQAYFQSQQNSLSPLFIYVFPALEDAAGFWIVWALFTSVLHLTLTLRGSRASQGRYGNLVAWAMVPFILRVIVQILNLVINKSAETVLPPHAAWIPADATGIMAFLRGAMGAMDAYWVLFAVLVIMGTVALSGLKTSKAVGSALIALGIMLLLYGLPALAGSVLGGLSGTGGGFYF
ncbi:MAG: YIP1 family protein [Anaerolineaceae bacterium]